MFSILKQALPYVLIALMAAWSLSLHREMVRLEDVNASLIDSIDRVSSMVEANDRAVVQWVNAHDAITERSERIHEELGKADDHHWGDASLPDDYVRVLREAGILHGGCDAPGSPAAGSGNPKTYRYDEPGTSGICSRR